MSNKKTNSTTRKHTRAVANIFPLKGVKVTNKFVLKFVPISKN